MFIKKKMYVCLDRLSFIDNIHRGYYMAARRYEIYLRVLKNISRVSAANE